MIRSFTVQQVHNWKRISMNATQTRESKHHHVRLSHEFFPQNQLTWQIQDWDKGKDDDDLEK